MFITSGDFDVALIVTNHYGCQDTVIQNDLISISGPLGEFFISDTLICQGDSVSFFPNVSNTDIYFWDFGDGNFSSDSMPYHFFQDSGIFTISLVIENHSDLRCNYHCKIIAIYTVPTSSISCATTPCKMPT